MIRYEGDEKNGRRKGKGAYYYHNGDCEIGNWQDDKKIGTFAYLTKNGEVKAKNY